jgi:hypothetical protein
VKDSVIHVEREARDGLEWAVLDGNGEPIEPRRREAPAESAIRFQLRPDTRQSLDFLRQTEDFSSHT